jgi:hypothetical protein
MSAVLPLGTISPLDEDPISPETVGLFAAIGIKKGTPFKPDAR